MSVTTIASRYAKSLIDLAKERGDLEAINEDMVGLKEIISNKDFYLLLKNPIVKIDKKLSIFDAIFDKKSNPLTLGFINILTRKGREDILPEITDEFIRQYKKLNSISTVKIKTANPLGDNILENIKSRLLESEATLDNIVVQTVVDQNLIGGFVIEIEDKLYDASVAHKLEAMKKEFSSNNFQK